MDMAECQIWDVHNLFLQCRTAYESLLDNRQRISPWDLEWQEEPAEWVHLLHILIRVQTEKSSWEETLKKPEKEVDDLNSAEDGEASEKTHCASNQTQLGFHGNLKKYFFMIYEQKKSYKKQRFFSISPFHPSQIRHRLPCQSIDTLPPALRAPAW